MPEMHEWRGEQGGAAARRRRIADDDPWGVESDTDGSILAMQRYARDPENLAIEVSLAGCRPGPDHWAREYDKARPVQPPRWERPNLLPVLHARGERVHVPGGVRVVRSMRGSGGMSPPPAQSSPVTGYVTKSGSRQRYGSHHAGGHAAPGATAGWAGLVGLPAMS